MASVLDALLALPSVTSSDEAHSAVLQAALSGEPVVVGAATAPVADFTAALLLFLKAHVRPVFAAPAADAVDVDEPSGAAVARLHVLAGAYAASIEVGAVSNVLDEVGNVLRLVTAPTLRRGAALEGGDATGTSASESEGGRRREVPPWLLWGSNGCQLFAKATLLRLQRPVLCVLPTAVVKAVLGVPGLGAGELPLLAAALEGGEGAGAPQTPRRPVESASPSTTAVWTNPDDGEEAVLAAEADVAGNMTIPFRQHLDSRHLFSSKEQARVYNNRERIRDGFLELLREFQRVQNSTDATALQDFERRMPDRCRAFMATVLPSNLLWFAELFEEELLQLGATVASVELDRDVQRLVPDHRRLQRLHSRFSDGLLGSPRDDSRSPPVFSSPTSRRQSSRRHRGGKSSAPRSRPSHPPTRRPPDPVTAAPKPHAAASAFPGTQRFFFVFLTVVDSHTLSSALIARFCDRLQASCFAKLPVRPHDVLKTSAQLRVVGKCLGLLLFCPWWSAFGGGDADTSPARSSQIEAAVGVASAASPPAPLRDWLAAAMEQGMLVLVTPWICEVGAMLAHDAVSKQVPFYRGFLSDLHRLHRLLRRCMAGSPGAPPLTRCRLAALLQLQSTLALLPNPPPEDTAPTSAVQRALELPRPPAGIDDRHNFVGTRFLTSCCPKLSNLMASLARRAAAPPVAATAWPAPASPTLSPGLPAPLSTPPRLAVRLKVSPSRVVPRAASVEPPFAALLHPSMSRRLATSCFHHKPAVRLLVDALVSNVVPMASMASSAVSLPPALDEAEAWYTASTATAADVGAFKAAAVARATARATAAAVLKARHECALRVSQGLAAIKPPGLGVEDGVDAAAWKVFVSMAVARAQHAVTDQARQLLQAQVQGALPPRLAAVDRRRPQNSTQ